MVQMLEEFKAFLLRGNVVDLAVGVVIGVAFAAVVNSLVADIITPVIGAIGGKPSFAALSFSINDSRFFYGNFINNVISFVTIAAAVFFLVVVPVNKLMERMKTERPTDLTTRDCPQCLSTIPMAARRCAFCTSEVAAG